tara:strand:- start:355 stop:474 length:120 start_codon:yes stop_codon:yes gene_type:complete
MASADYEVEAIEVELFDGHWKDWQVMTIKSSAEWYLLNK